MNIRVVDDQEQAPAVLHRRRLQAKRTQNYRRRKKANRDIKGTDDQAELLPQTVESESKSGQTETDAREFRQDKISSRDISITPSQEGNNSSLDNIKPAYYDEEPISIPYAEEHTEYQSPECYTNVQADPPDNNI